MKLALLSVFLALPVARAQTIPNGAIYEAAVGAGISYISPATGAQVLDQKAGLNWKSLVNGAASTGTITAVIAGLTKVIAMSTPWTVGLSMAHLAWDSWGSGVLAIAAPNPGTIVQSLIQPNQATTLNGSCVEGSMFAQIVKGAKPIGPLNVDGVAVTFSPQGVAVLVNASGSKIKDFGVYDVLACPWTVPPPAPVQMRPQVPGESSADPGANIQTLPTTSSGLFVDTPIDPAMYGWQLKIMYAHAKAEAARQEAIEEGQ